MSPAQALLSSSTGTSSSSVSFGLAQPSRVAGASQDDGGTTTALVFASAAAVILVLVLPVLVGVTLCYLKRTRGGARIDPKVLTSIVPVDMPSPAMADAATQWEGGVDEAASLPETATAGHGARLAAGDVGGSAPRGAPAVRGEGPQPAAPVRTEMSPNPRAPVALTL